MDMERTRFALKKALHSLKNFECYVDLTSTPYKAVVVSDKFRNTDATARNARVSKLFKEGCPDIYKGNNFALECFTHAEWDKVPEAKRRAYLSGGAAPAAAGGFKKAA